MTSRDYRSKHRRLGLLEGDGIGPEIVPAAVEALEAALATAGARPVDWVKLPLGASAIETHGDAAPADLIVLAQYSITSARGTLADRLGRPVLSPPLLAVMSLREALA